MLQNKELEATEERKRKAKQLEMQRKESARSGRGIPRTPVYPTYTPPARTNASDSYDSYEAEKNKSFNKYVTLSLDGVPLVDNSFQACCSQGQGYAPRQEVQDDGYVRASPW
jgi:hypothetical protein